MTGVPRETEAAEGVGSTSDESGLPTGIGRSPRAPVSLVCCVLIAIVGCAEVYEAPNASRPDSSDEPGGPDIAQRLGDEATSSSPQSPMPAALRAAWIRRVQSDAGPDYAVAQSRSRRLEARHPRQDLRTRFEGDAVVLTDRGGREPLRMTLASVNGNQPGRATISHAANRVTVARREIEEWYVHGPMGLEQGFTIPAPLPSGEAFERSLRLAMAIEGNYAPTTRGDVIVWRSANRALETRELYAFDADGKRLPASMHASRTELVFEVDLSEAQYPVVIDPLWLEQQVLLPPSNDATNAYLGRSVSISGDTAVIGAQSDAERGSNAGAAHVFVRNGTVWTEQQKLVPSDGVGGEYFGTSVSLSGDTALIGAYLDDDNGAQSGSAYVFVRNGGVWTEQQKLLASDAEAGDQFGWAVSVSGDTAAIGAALDDDNGTWAGAAYVFVRSGTVWTEQQKLFPSDSAANDQFGSSVSASGDTVAVGARLDADNGSSSGSAYVFVRSGAVWTEQQKLLPSDGAGGDEFGRVLSLSGDTVVVAARYDDDNGISSGSAYVFVRSGTVWSEQQKLLASDGAASDGFGTAVSISGDTVVIGAELDDDNGASSGSAYVFVRSGTAWTEQDKLLASNGVANDRFGASVSVSGDLVLSGAPTGVSPGRAFAFERTGTVWTEEQELLRPDAAGDFFGAEVSIDGDTAVIGASNDDDKGDGSGSAYVFVRSGTAWTLQQKLLAFDGAADDDFGLSVSISGDTALIGARFDDDNGGNSGSAYVFVRTGTTWAEQQKLLPSDGASGDFFGDAVDVSGDTAIIGGWPNDDLGSRSGSAYVFVRTGTVWTEQQKLLASDGETEDFFGSAVSISGDTVAVSAQSDDHPDGSSGSVYVFVRSGTVWTEQQKLPAPDGTASGLFAYRISLSGDTLVVGARGATGAVASTGAAYVYVRSGTTWTQQQKLFASDGAAGDDMGIAVDSFGDTAVLGVWRDDDNGNQSGSAYVFVRDGTVWTEQDKLLASDGAASDGFGAAVGVWGDTVISAALLSDQQGTDAGSAYVFLLRLEIGDPCTADGECLSGFCDTDGSVCACDEEADCGVGQVCDGSEAPNACEDADTCGNDVLEAGEACDDGNTVTGDGCSATCFVDNLPDGSDCTLVGAAACASGVCDTTETPDRCEAADSCGNDVLEAGEACDDGNVLAGDGCSATCFVDNQGNGSDCTAGGDAACASGVCDATETPDRCEAADSCGNGVVEAGEACDDGNTVVGDGCSATCFIDNQGNGSDCTTGGDASCMSGVCDTTETPDRCEAADSCGNNVLEAGEACDDGNAAAGDGCSATCLVENGGACAVGADCASGICDATEPSPVCEPPNACGNAVLENAEACDDGNVAAGDGCSATCLFEVGAGPCTVGAQCVSGRCNTLVVPSVCAVPVGCGNGTIEIDEGCDDGNLVPGDGCNAACLIEDGGPCIDGTQCASGVCDSTEALPVCEPPNACGNGATEGGEACDDGNTASGDGCAATCFIDSRPIGDDCSDGRDAACASGVCDTTETPDLCEAADVCGNGALEGAELCDDGNVTSQDGCSADCSELDDLPDGTGCSAHRQCASGRCDTRNHRVCEPPNRCGNGAVEGSEACDDGDVISGDGCSATCVFEVGAGPCTDGVQCVTGECDLAAVPPVCVAPPGCGNNVLEVNEGCDDGNTLPDDGCNSVCLIEEGSPCAGSTECATGVCDTTEAIPVCELANTCGNGTIEGAETCDDGNRTAGDGCDEACALNNLWRGGGGCAVGARSESHGSGWLLSFVTLGLIRRRRRESGCKARSRAYR